jgi:hypothetical protein
MPAATAPDADLPIALRLQGVDRLFHTLDPAPFREGDLAAEAEDYIIAWAGDLPADRPLTILVRLPAAELDKPLARAVPEAVPGHFARRALAETRAIRDLFHSGRIALAIGLAILAACLLLVWQTEKVLPESTAMHVVREGLTIVGWVALWRPAEIFLYDWLPLARRRRLYRRLAAARVVLEADPPG